jgi:hypothetical protein
MMSEQTFSLLLGLIIIAEAIIFLIWMYLIKENENDWKTRFNTNTMLIDIVFGMIILFNSMEKMNLVGIAVLILIITHIYREIEYFNRNKKSKMLKNGTLFLINSIKLLCLMGMIYFIY